MVMGRWPRFLAHHVYRLIAYTIFDHLQYLTTSSTAILIYRVIINSETHFGSKIELGPNFGHSAP